MRLRLEAAAGLEPVKAGHHRVEQDHVGGDLVDERQREVAPHRDQHRRAGTLDRLGQEAQGVGRVVDDEDHVATEFSHRRRAP